MITKHNKNISYLGNEDKTSLWVYLLGGLIMVVVVAIFVWSVWSMIN